MTTIQLSPTQELVRMARINPGHNQVAEFVSEVERLRADNMALRRKLAHMTAQYVWAEGGSFSRIDEEIRQYGFRLESMDSASDPRIVPL